MKRLMYVTILFFLSSCQLSAQEYRNTIIAPHLNVTVGETGNVIYTSSFALAWKMLENDILKNKVIIKQPLSLIDHLNDSDPAMIDDHDGFVAAGFVEDGIAQVISAEMKHKFNEIVDLSEYTRDLSNIICYSFFRKDIQFKTKFETFNQPFPFYSGGKQYDISCFGIWTAGTSDQHRAIRELVQVIDYRNQKDFIINISNPGEKDEVIIAACNPEKTLGETIEAVIRRIQTSEISNLADNDRVIIPKVVINAHKQYRELYGVHLANRNFERYFFAEALHDINFALNESGAFADSEATIVLKKGSGPRTMIISHPFLVMMKEKKSDKPFFAAWIANPEVLAQVK